jgi:hypothetical protein
MSNVAKILDRLDKVKPNGTDKWMARCPAHDDGGPSLAIRDQDGKVLIHCFAGCEPLSVLESIGLEMKDLFPETPKEHRAEGRYIRQRISASTALEVISRELTLAHLVLADIVKNKKVEPETWRRFEDAYARISTVLAQVSG